MNKLLLYLLIIYDTTNMHWHHKWHHVTIRLFRKIVRVRKAKLKYYLLKKYQISPRNRIGRPLLEHKGNI